MSGVEVTSSNNCFVHRVTALPLVAAGSEMAMEQYNRAKGYNSLLKTYMTFFEKSAYAAKQRMDPIVGKAQAPLDKLSEVACRGLDKVEEMFPAVKMSPEELKQAGVEYYGKSYMRRGMDSVKVVGVRMDEAKSAISARASSMASYGMDTLNSSLNYCEYVVDTYVAEEEEPTSEKIGASSSQDRLRVIVGKLYSGVQLKASRKLTNARKFVEINVVDLERVANLVKTANGTTIGRVSEAGRNAASSVQTWTSSQISKLQPEKYLLQFVKGSTSFFVVLSTRALNLAAPRLTPTLSERANQLNGQLLGAEQVVAQAESLHQLSDEAKERFLNEETMNSTYEYLSSIRPFSWLERKVPTKVEEEILEVDEQETDEDDDDSSESGSE